MRLLAWKVSTRWTSFHISAIGKPLCGTPVPDKVQASIDKPAEIKDWAHVCAKCRALAIKGATGDERSDAPVLKVLA
jgi:hypothetical protein